MSCSIALWAYGYILVTATAGLVWLANRWVR